MTDREGQAKDRMFRGLALTFVLSFLNLAGLMFTATSIGGLDRWTVWQFAGLFGLVEAAAGLASIVLPNVWHLPVAEHETSKRTEIKLAASSILLPHWGSAARFLAGTALLIAAGYHEGVGAATLLIVPAVLLLALAVLNLSLVIARYGVARPGIDVVQFIIKWRGKTSELRPISLGAAFLQFVVGICTLPAAKLLPPSFLFGPELRLSFAGMLAIFCITAVSVAAVLIAWSGRISWQAPREQQAEIEAHA